MMKFDRRQLLLGTAALGMMPSKAEAWLHPGASGIVPIGHGWNTLPLGAGGLVTGFHIANDNSIVCRTDVGNIYRWTGKTTTTTNPSDQWVPLLTFASLAGITSNPRCYDTWGGTELVQAPSDATKLWAIFSDLFRLYPSPIYYSTNSGTTWAASNLTIANTDPNSSVKLAYYRIAVDPANPSVVYVGAPISNGNSYAVSFANDGHTFSFITALGQTTVGNGVAGICFDASSGTVVVGGQTRTARVIIPVGGSDIYESLDGGVTFNSTGAATAFGTASFSVFCAVINSGGVYYANVPGNGLWRYSGAWTNIQPYAVSTGDVLVIDPADPTYLTVTGAHGLRAGFTSTNANTGTPSWAGSGNAPYGNVIVTAPSYDLPYITAIFGQGGSSFFFATCIKIDGNGDTIISGNQSIFKLSGRLTYTGGSGSTQTVISFGRGQEATVAQEAWRPSGGTYPILGPQDISLMLGGTFTKYPTGQFPGHIEDVCSSIEESPTDGTFVVARVTSQGGATSATDSSGYSTDAGVSWTPYATFPTALWASNVHGSITSSVLTVTSFDSGTPLFVGQSVYTSGNTYSGTIYSLGTGGGGTGTYNLGAGPVDRTSQALFLQAANHGGQIIAADNNHHLMVPSGLGHGSIPVYTTNQGGSWALCNGLPAGMWMANTWVYGSTNNKSIAVGLDGGAIGTVWAALKTSSTTITIYKSTDYGANFSPTANTVTVNSSWAGVYLLAVPGHPTHLWLVGQAGRSLWQSTDSGDNWTSKTMPNDQATYCSIGAIDPVSGTYPTIWMMAWTASDPTANRFLYYSINGASSWSVLGSSVFAGQRVDLPAGQQLYGINSVRADRQIFKRLYCGCGQTGFAYYNP